MQYAHRGLSNVQVVSPCTSHPSFGPQFPLVLPADLASSPYHKTKRQDSHTISAMQPPGLAHAIGPPGLQHRPAVRTTQGAAIRGTKQPYCLPQPKKLHVQALSLLSTDKECSLSVRFPPTPHKYTVVNPRAAAVTHHKGLSYFSALVVSWTGRFHPHFQWWQYLLGEKQCPVKVVAVVTSASDPRDWPGKIQTELCIPPLGQGCQT